MVRGPKKHLKRLNAPSHWMLDKLGGIFVSHLTSRVSSKHRMRQSWMNYSCMNAQWCSVRCLACLHTAIDHPATVANIPTNCVTAQYNACNVTPRYKLPAGSQAIAWTAQAEGVPTTDAHAQESPQVRCCSSVVHMKILTWYLTIFKWDRTGHEWSLAWQTSSTLLLGSCVICCLMCVLLTH